MADGSNPGSAEALQSMQRELNSMKTALGLLGVKGCAVCGKYYLTSNPGAMFTGCGDAVCYECFPNWWPKRCSQLSVDERDEVEHRVMRWLVANHGAKIYRDLSELPTGDREFVHIVVGCFECKSTGKLGRTRCHHCLGNGHVWVITTK